MEPAAQIGSHRRKTMKASIRPIEVITPNAIQACAVSRVDFPPTHVVLMLRLPLAVSDALFRAGVLPPS